MPSSELLAAIGYVWSQDPESSLCTGPTVGPAARGLLCKLSGAGCCLRPQPRRRHGRLSGSISVSPFWSLDQNTLASSVALGGG